MSKPIVTEITNPQTKAGQPVGLTPYGADMARLAQVEQSCNCAAFALTLEAIANKSGLSVEQVQIDYAEYRYQRDELNALMRAATKTALFGGE